MTSINQYRARKKSDPSLKYDVNAMATRAEMARDQRLISPQSLANARPSAPPILTIQHTGGVRRTVEAGRKLIAVKSLEVSWLTKLGHDWFDDREGRRRGNNRDDE